MVGSVEAGRRTRGTVRWSIQRSDVGSWVEITGHADALGAFDRLLWACGGRRWLARSLELALDALDERMRQPQAYGRTWFRVVERHDDDRLRALLRRALPARSRALRAARRAGGIRVRPASDHYHPWIARQGHSPFIWGVLEAISGRGRRLPGCAVHAQPRGAREGDPAVREGGLRPRLHPPDGT
jgi:hypothetical protein